MTKRMHNKPKPSRVSPKAREAMRDWAALNREVLEISTEILKEDQRSISDPRVRRAKRLRLLLARTTRVKGLQEKAKPLRGFSAKNIGLLHKEVRDLMRNVEAFRRIADISDVSESAKKQIFQQLVFVGFERLEPVFDPASGSGARQRRLIEHLSKGREWRDIAELVRKSTNDAVARNLILRLSQDYPKSPAISRDTPLEVFGWKIPITKTATFNFTASTSLGGVAKEEVVEIFSRFESLLEAVAKQKVSIQVDVQ